MRFGLPVGDFCARLTPATMDVSVMLAEQPWPRLLANDRICGTELTACRPRQADSFAILCSGCAARHSGVPTCWLGSSSMTLPKRTFSPVSADVRSFGGQSTFRFVMPGYLSVGVKNLFLGAPKVFGGDSTR